MKFCWITFFNTDNQYDQNFLSSLFNKEEIIELDFFQDSSELFLL